MLPGISTPEEAQQGNRIMVRFGIVFGLEFILIALAGGLLALFQAYLFIPAATALIIGVHFFPLANLFKIRGIGSRRHYCASWG